VLETHLPCMGGVRPHTWVGVGGGPSYRLRVCRLCGLLAVDLLDERSDLLDEDRRVCSSYIPAREVMLRNPGPIRSTGAPARDRKDA